MTETYQYKSNAITLSDFIRDNQRRFGATGNLSNILLSIALSTKVVSQGINRAGLASMVGLAGSQNVQGEQVQKLDVYADSVFDSILGKCGEVISMVSEEREQLFPAKDGGGRSKYVVVFDPLDGSSNIDVNVSIGSVWGIYPRLTEGPIVDKNDMSDFLQPGHRFIAAGYTIYGSSTMFVYSSGEGVNGFTLDPSIGEFILTHPQLTIPEDGEYYSCNSANSHSWSEGVRRYVQYLKSPDSGKKHSLRYVGSMVADFHRTLLKGGIFMYPADKKNINGKLRLLYECNPMAYLAEQAGGKASDGSKRILSLMPTGIHQRSEMFIGSGNMIDELEEFIKKFDS